MGGAIFTTISVVDVTNMLWVQLEVAKRTTGVQLIQDHEYKPERLRLKHLQCMVAYKASIQIFFLRSVNFGIKPQSDLTT